MSGQTESPILSVLQGGVIEETGRIVPLGTPDLKITHILLTQIYACACVSARARTHNTDAPGIGVLGPIRLFLSTAAVLLGETPEPSMEFSRHRQSL